MKIQKQTFTGGIFKQGSFALHKIHGNFTGHCSAWYDSDGKMTDCEWIRRDGRVCLIPRYKPMWQHLERIGKLWK